MQIRPDTPQDYAAIADIHARAFGCSAEVPSLVALLRQRVAFDPALSLVAEEGGRLLGHVLFTPELIRLMGADVSAVNLSPLGVLPEAQRRGVGAALIAAGHAAAREKGYALSFLVGHPSYYPRFGYRTHAYGKATLPVAAGDLAPDNLEAVSPGPDHLPALAALWQHEEADVDISIRPGPSLLDWLSPNPAIAARVWLRDEAIVGYTRVHAGRPARPLFFLAADHAAARAIAAELALAAGQPELTLPLHPASASAAAFAQPAAVQVWEPAMVCPLRPDVYEPYTAAVAVGERSVGRVIWPVAFDLE
jgi:predicted N-acetyltransferase YhbS